MTRKQKFPRLSAEQAHAALRWLHALGKVTAKDIEKALGHRDARALAIVMLPHHFAGGVSSPSGTVHKQFVGSFIGREIQTGESNMAPHIVPSWNLFGGWLREVARLRAAR